MNMDALRQSFTVFVADSDVVRGGQVVRMLSDIGYSCEHRLDNMSLEEHLIRNPPHMIFFNYEDQAFFRDEKGCAEYLTGLKERLPETHVFLLCSAANKNKAVGLYLVGIDDVFVWPADYPIQMTHSVDRAAMSDFYFYKCEQATESEGMAPVSSQTDFAFLEIFQKALKQNAARAELLQLTLQELARHFGCQDAYYFRYVPSSGTLAVAHSYGVQKNLVESVGVHLKKDEPGFQEQMLLHPQRLRALREFVLQGLSRKDMYAYPHIEHSLVRGVFVLPAPSGVVFPDALKENPYAEICLTLLRDRLELMDLRAKYQRLSVYDEESEALRADYIQRKINEEVSRARRISRPVSLLLVSVDKFEDIALEQTKQHFEQFLQSLTGLFVQNSRLNDLVGRLERDRYVIVLPHTPKKGAVIKAERFRRTIEATDFSPILAGRKNVTLSIGISEYPTVCHDSDGLMGSAEAALLEVQRFGSNKVCLAVAPNNFTPDFAVEHG